MYIFPNMKATESDIIKLGEAGGKSIAFRDIGDFFFALNLIFLFYLLLLQYLSKFSTSFVGSGSCLYQVFDPRPISYLEHCIMCQMTLLGV